MSGVSAALQVTGNAYFSNNIGIGTTSPKTRIDVSGTLRLASGGEACDSDRTGAIRYTNGDFEFCRDGTTWQDLASIADSAAPDRIVSGTTTMVVVSSTGFISLTQGGTSTGWFDPQRGLVTLGVSSTGPISATAGHFSGTVSATLLKLAADPVASCTNDSLGTVKIANGRVFVCRP